MPNIFSGNKTVVMFCYNRRQYHEWFFEAAFNNIEEATAYCRRLGCSQYSTLAYIWTPAAFYSYGES